METRVLGKSVIVHLFIPLTQHYGGRIDVDETVLSVHGCVCMQVGIFLPPA